MSAEPLHVHYTVDGGNFTSAGEASVKVKRLLRQLGCSPEMIRRVSIAMYEGEINMVIHANGGDADVYVDDESIRIVLKDTGPGIKDVEQAMQEGYSTAPEAVHRHLQAGYRGRPGNDHRAGFLQQVTERKKERHGIQALRFTG